MLRFLFLSALVVSSALAAPFAFNFSSFVRNQYITARPDGGVRAKLVPSNTGTPVIQSRLAMPAQFSREVYFQYQVLFEPGFEWVKGGKLPGLFGGPQGVAASGCVSQPLNAWSVRLMWTRNGAIQLYLYDQSRRRTGIGCGTYYNTNRSVLTVGRWTTLQIHVKLNSGAGKADGSAALYIDGTKTLDMPRVELRGVNTGATIDWVVFNVFYGGHDPSWSPSKTTFIQFRRPRCSQTMLQ